MNTTETTPPGSRLVRRTDERATVDLCWMNGVLMQRWEWLQREWCDTYWHSTAKTEWRTVPTTGSVERVVRSIAVKAAWAKHIGCSMDDERVLFAETCGWPKSFNEFRSGWEAAMSPPNQALDQPCKDERENDA